MKHDAYIVSIAFLINKINNKYIKGTIIEQIRYNN